MSAGVFGRAAEPVVIDVWSDVVCPFCYLGNAVLKEAIEQFPHGSSVEVRYHSFQLNPGFPAGDAVLADDYLARSYGMPKAQIEGSHAQLAARGAQSGLDYKFETAMMVNTLDAHRMIHLAKEHGRELTMVDRLFRAEFTEGLNLADHDVLAGLAAELGLDRAAALEALRAKAYEKDIRADLAQARQLGISGVPFFVFDNKRAVSGAQPVELFRRALDVTWQDRAAAPA
ncbi:DsbA family oxidoreductase [Paractinoplanes brasiliensis]|uniref:Putative DsbA family dithiol-disulfide isomerase n=1 Tax=Paractinoplanes brasiliensis TaxID=52695 RepID=A0A4R6J8V2_9ACTN|nr:DsbA family oxidoreductase [Actinoplanes brasiliensis]TDO31321.1 putative DsbA family dithiol-disulfide isomerase [Actinoplanes brasiliensis]GID28355.1 DSBA oxidoreductase [Actinoplanes brasiliensis]